MEGDRQSAEILSHSPGALNLSSKKLFTVNYLDICLHSTGAAQCSVGLKSQEFTLFRSAFFGDFRN